ncbi:MAG: MBL fold metallo-hydrolase [Chloroflexota bacterium]|jgi:L-ascorbate metabolism protein UlaG (beta-lactamase superfamily)|nr:MBL fold metallo-hydrolase [Caldilinea sp.]GIK75435.1 MAG: MBL fold metallo-hydrolase [Chloroflexota bacterium]
MDITWYGLSCFRIREGGVTIICDPYDKSVGLTLAKARADIVTVSHDRAGHNAVDRITGDPKILTGPGEYEVKNVFITGLTTYHRRDGSHAPERNVAFFFEFGGLTVGHMGDIGEVPAQSEIEELNIGEVDVLMVPVGGGDTLDPARAVELVGLLEPRLVIPMHYNHPGLGEDLATKLESVDKFLKEFGAANIEPVDTLKVAKSTLPEETQVVLLTPTL